MAVDLYDGALYIECTTSCATLGEIEDRLKLLLYPGEAEEQRDVTLAVQHTRANPSCSTADGPASMQNWRTLMTAVRAAGAAVVMLPSYW